MSLLGLEGWGGEALSEENTVGAGPGWSLLRNGRRAMGAYICAQM